jgi:predicted DNA binding protein
MAVRKSALATVEDITRAIRVLRGRRVILDAELAVLYGVTTRRLNEQVRRNHKRFPDDFLFELTTEEFANLKSHFATSSWGGRRKLPLAFTEHGSIQAATILNSPRAVEISVYVVRAFVKLREVLSTDRKLVRRFEQLELRLNSKITKHDESIAAILWAIRELMKPPEPPRRGIGFTADLGDASK